MTTTEFYKELATASCVSEVEAALTKFQDLNRTRWVPLGRENNQGPIEVASDPARSIVERLTNAIDGVLELEHERHLGLPTCRSPHEAANAWLGVPENRLSGMTSVQRRTLAQRVAVHLEPGEERESRVVEIRDRGIGLTSQKIPSTILSLNESNKVQKHYLAGAYGQGGSSTFAFSKYTLIASRYMDFPVGFTLVKFMDLPPEQYKIGHYVYLVFEDGTLPEAALSQKEFPSGTQARHFGYDLSSYPSPLGPSSLYGSLNTNLFDPIMPIWLDNQVHNYRRVIKGSRNALNGAVDDGDERSGPKLSHNVPMFNVSLADFGRLGIEYWVLEQPTKENKRPSAAYVNPSRPIILTRNGQNHGELSQLLIRKHAGLPFLTQRLICHIDCNNLTPAAKRRLFSSTRESEREVKVRELIQQELVKVLVSDDTLTRLNEEAKKQGAQEQDETAIQQMRAEVARLLRIHGLELGQAVGGDERGREPGTARPAIPRPKPRPLEPINLHEPPTYLRIVWDKDESISFYPEQRRYLRIETDANSTYHNANDPTKSRVNIIVGDHLVLCGSTDLRDGRMRIIVEGLAKAQIGETGKLRVELTRPSLPVLTDERSYQIVKPPEAKPAGRKVTLPPFRLEPVNGPDDPRWTEIGWSDNPAVVASEAEMESGTLVIYYSTAFPKYSTQRHALEMRDPVLAISFTRRYEIWLAVHSLLYYQDQQAAKVIQNEAGSADEQHSADDDSDLATAREQQERCRIAVMSCLFATREVQAGIPQGSIGEE